MGFMNIRHLITTIKIAAVIVISVAGIYTALGFYGLPKLIKSKLPIFIQQQTGRKADLAVVRFDPFSLQLSVQGFELQEPEGQLFARFDELFIDINALQSIAQAALVIDKVMLNKPVVRISRQQDGAFNFSDLINNKGEAKQDGGNIFPLTIANLAISDGKLDWEDSSLKSPEKETIYPINLAVDNVTTRVDKQSRLRLSLTLHSGGTLDWQGVIGLNPVSSSGHIKLDKVQLPRIRALALQDLVQFDLQGYELFEADYKADYDNNKFNLNIKQGAFELHDVQLFAPKQDKALVNNFKLAVSGIGFDLGKHELAIESVLANDADVKAWLDADGVFNYQALLPVAQANPGETSPAEINQAPQQIPWNISINTIAVNNFGLSFEDRTLKKPLTLSAKPINFKLSNFSNKAGASLPFGLSVVVNERGLMKLDGTTIIEPLSAEIAVDVKDIALENFQAYVDKFARLDVIDGTLAVDGKVSVAKTAPEKLQFKFTGNTNIADLLTRDQLKNKDLVRWDNLKLSGIDVDFPANQYSAETLIINKPYARVIIRKDKTVNFSDILIKSPPNPPFTKGGVEQNPHPPSQQGGLDQNNLLSSQKAGLEQNNLLSSQKAGLDQNNLLSSQKAGLEQNNLLSSQKAGLDQNNPPPLEKGGRGGFSKPTFKLGKIEIIDGSSDFADLSLILPFAAQIKSLDGGASGISSEQKSTIKVDLKGNAYDLAPVDIKGNISPYLGDYNVTVHFTGMPMPLISSYMVQFAGYKVEKGKMSLGLNYQVADKKLTASNNILIDQLELGEKVENPNAVSLPLELAVALMKDADGKIKIDVPISGSLEDPQFSVSHIVVDALVNAISKVISSPFRALASLIGSEQDLSTISFAAGEAELNKQQISKLDDLAKALKTRPVLKLEIKGAAFQEPDWPAVSDDALYDQLKKIKAAEVNKQGGRKIRAEYVVISDQDYRRLMEQLFIEKFPLMVEKSLLGKTRLVGTKADTDTDKFYAVAKEKLSAIIKPEPQRLKDLATERAQAIANYVVKKGGIANERVFILDTVLDPEREGAGIVSLLSLKTD